MKILKAKTLKVLLISLLCVPYSLLQQSSVFAAAFTVTSFSDGIDIAPGDGICQAPASTGCTLRAAVMEANDLAGTDTIIVPAGTYILTLPGTNEDEAVTGDLDILDNIEINGSGMSTTIIDGGGIDRVFDNRSSEVVVRISKLTIQGGSPPPNDQGGAGIRHWNGDLYLDTVKMINNIVPGTASGDTGGGIKNLGNYCSIIDSDISGNHAQRGGAIFTNSNIDIRRSLFSSNSAGSGGGITNYGQAAIINSTFSGNTATSGGGSYYTSGGASDFLHVTIFNDLSQSAIAIGAELNMSNTIIANSNGLNCTDSGSFMSSGGGNLEDSDDCGFNLASDTVNTDPKLETLQDNGGTTKTHALMSDSPAIDHGVSQALTTKDQRGIRRPQGKALDSGAYEREYSFPWTLFYPSIMKKQ
jgi:hypothetical protein